MVEKPSPSDTVHINKINRVNTYRYLKSTRKKNNLVTDEKIFNFVLGIQSTRMRDRIGVDTFMYNEYIYSCRCIIIRGLSILASSTTHSMKIISQSNQSQQLYTGTKL